MRPSTNIASLSLREIKGQNVKEKGLSHLGNSPGAPKRNKLFGHTGFILEGEEIFRLLSDSTKWHGLLRPTGRM